MTQTVFCRHYEGRLTFQSFPLQTAQVLVQNLHSDPDTDFTKIFAKADAIIGANYKQEDQIELRPLVNNDFEFV